MPPEYPSSNFPPSWKVAPTDSLPIVRDDAKAGHHDAERAVRRSSQSDARHLAARGVADMAGGGTSERCWTEDDARALPGRADDYVAGR